MTGTARSRKRAGAGRPPRTEPGHTNVDIEQPREGRLPHERDESSDSQRPPAPHESMQQGHQDVQRGLQDTSRGETSDPTYRKLKPGKSG